MPIYKLISQFGKTLVFVIITKSDLITQMKNICYNEYILKYEG